MKRRDLIGVWGDVAASWPLAAGAQQAVVKVPRIGCIQANPMETSGDVGTQAN